MRRGEWHDRARAMKAADPARSDGSIAAEIGVTSSAVWKVLNPERARQHNEHDAARPERKAAKRAWEDAHRATCARCGKAMGEGSARADGTRRLGDLCKACISDVRVERAMEMVALRRSKGLTNIEIASRIGISVSMVASELSRLHALGFDVPAAPYNRAKRKATRVIDKDVRVLGRTLAARGIHVPALAEQAAA